MGKRVHSTVNYDIIVLPTTKGRSMHIELDDKEIGMVLRALGKEKTWYQEGGFYRLAHMMSDIMVRIKDAAQEKTTT
jgi:hypothetical protein